MIRQQEHLKGCNAYKLSIQQTGHDGVGIDSAMVPGQSVLDSAIHKLNKAQNNERDKRIALAFYMNSISFNVIQSRYFLAYHQMVASGYKPPTVHALQTTLLDESYEDVKSEVNKILDATYYLNIITDESTNINKERIINLSINIVHGTFYFVSQEIGAESMNAANTAAWLMKQLDGVVKGDWTRVNSFATDTCSTMRRVWRILDADSRLDKSKSFFVPCDSHGIQLLIKDLLHVPYYEKVLSKVTNIITAFRASPKQLALLRQVQVECYGKTIALVLSVITRWGTQAQAIESVYKNKEALKAFIQLPEGNIKDSLVMIIRDRMFWVQVEELRDLIRPISILQQASESDSLHLGLVAERWRSTLGHIQTMEAGQSDIEPLIPIVEKRMKRQLEDIHWTAFYLTPKNSTVAISLETQNSILVHIGRMYSHGPTADKVIADYFAYRAHEGPFSDTNVAWKIGNPVVFWQAYYAFSTELAQLAIRLFKTPANSVPSERSCSAQNFIHNKFRNRLHQSKVDKLTFIYKNRRVLNRKPPEQRRWEDLSNQDEIEMEDQVLDLHQSEDMNNDMSTPGIFPTVLHKIIIENSINANTLSCILTANLTSKDTATDGHNPESGDMDNTEDVQRYQKRCRLTSSTTAFHY